jgi:NAD/NADP transhydrogenase beta subunit
MMRVRWRERPRAHRWAIVGAFVGMAVAAIAVIQYVFHGSTFDRWLIVVAGFLGGGAVGLLLAKVTTR